MERDAIDVDAVVDTAYSTEDPAAAFEAFLALETCKPVFRFGE